MPTPPRKGENRSDFINRCMGDESMKNEFPDQKQRVAVCMSKWSKANEEPLNDEEKSALAFLMEKKDVGEEKA